LQLFLPFSKKNVFLPFQRVFIFVFTVFSDYKLPEPAVQLRPLRFSSATLSTVFRLFRCRHAARRGGFCRKKPGQKCRINTFSYFSCIAFVILVL